MSHATTPPPHQQIQTQSLKNEVPPSLPRDEQNNKKESSESIIDEKLLESLNEFIGLNESIILNEREWSSDYLINSVLNRGLAYNNKELTLDKLQKLQSSFQTKSKSNEEEAIDKLIDFLEKYKTERQELGDVKSKNIEFDLLKKSLERLQELVLIENKEGILDNKILKIDNEISKLEDFEQEEKEEKEKEKERYENMRKKNGLSEEEKKEKENLEKISQIVSKKLELCILAKSAKKENDYNKLKEDAKNLLETLKNQQNEKSKVRKMLDTVKEVNRNRNGNENYLDLIKRLGKIGEQNEEEEEKEKDKNKDKNLENSETRGLESETKPTPTEEKAKLFSEEEMAKTPRKNLWPQAKDLVPMLQYIQAANTPKDDEPEEIKNLRKIKEEIDEYCKDGKPFPIGDIHGDPVLFVSYMVLSGNATLDKDKPIVEKIVKDEYDNNCIVIVKIK